MHKSSKLQKKKKKNVLNTYSLIAFIYDNLLCVFN